MTSGLSFPPPSLPPISSLSHSLPHPCRTFSFFSPPIDDLGGDAALGRVGRRFRHGRFLLRQRRHATRPFVVSELRYFVAGIKLRFRLENARHRLCVFHDLLVLQSHIPPNLRLRELHFGRHRTDDADGAKDFRFSV